MKNCRKMVRIAFTATACLLLLSSRLLAQLNIGAVDPGPYTPGSTLAATFTIDQSSCMRPGNKFTLYLSDANGNFIGETPIGDYKGFYSTFVNGKIPLGMAPGIGYRIRIKSDKPVSTSLPSVPFEIKSGGSVLASITSNPLPLNSETFGFCSTFGGRIFYLTNESSDGSQVTATIKDEIAGTTASISFTSSFQTLKASLSHYTIITKAVMPDGTVATKANLLINNDPVTAFSTVGNNIVCIPSGQLKFKVNTADLAQNFPGNTYWINWGDGTSDEYTICDLKALGTFVTHTYFKSSCGSVSRTSSGTVYNAFDVTIKVKNDFCGDVGTPISSYAKVVFRPINKFDGPARACTNTPVKFLNNSQRGDDPNAVSVNCIANDVKYNWFVDDSLVAVAKPLNYNLVHSFPTNGEHTIRLESTNASACNAELFEQKICIQDPPKPKFALSSKTICFPGSVKVTDLSKIDSSCNVPNIYSWNVTPAITFANGTTSSSKEPEFNFTAPGKYLITLSISSASCGDIVSTPQTVIVNASPTAVLSPDIVLCNLATYDFSANTLGPTKTTFTGTVSELSDTYTWSITGGEYSFVNNTNLNSKYPSIKFDEDVAYIVNVTHTNNCETATASQKLSFIKAPVVNAGPDQATCFIGAGFALSGSVNGTISNKSWIGGSGTFSPDRNTLSATYTPTEAEKTAGSVNLILRAITGLTGPCAQVDDEVVLTIEPNLTITSAATETICSATKVNYIPKGSVEGASFIWTATGSASASGFAISGVGPINDQIINNDLSTDAEVSYLITPRLNGCDGVPFKLVVTITARSFGGTINGDVVVCNGANAGNISLNGQVGNVIRWERSVDGGVSWIPILSTANPYVFSNLTVSSKFRAIVSNGVCNEVSSTETTITVNPVTTISNAGANQSLCSGNQALLTGNNPAPDTGKWTLVSNQTGVIITDATLSNTTVTGLVAGEIYTFRWTITGLATCPSTFSEMKITYYSNLTNSISSNITSVCSGSAISINGNTPTGGSGTYTFQWQSSNDGALWTNINDKTEKDLSLLIMASTFYRRIVISSTCTSTSNPIQIVALPGLANNTISADQRICVGATANQLIGSSPTGGSGTYTFQWQSSLDNGVTWMDINGAVGSDFTPTLIIATALYRRLVSSGACFRNESNQVKITLNSPARAEITYRSDKGCSPFILSPTNVNATSYPNINDTYTWFADDVPIGVGITFPGFTIVGDNRDVVIKLVVTSIFGCNSAETSHTFSSQQSVNASYTQSASQGCGPLSINFTNTSNSLTASTFKWDFGNGTTSNLAQPPAVVYQADQTGKDITYTVTLNAFTPCGTTTQTSKVLVQGKAVSVFSPDQTAGCSPLAVNFTNTSPGSSGTTYSFNFDDGSPPVTTTDRSTVSHLFTTLVVRDYVITMTAENSCGKSTSNYTIRVSPNDITPEMVVNASELRGCAPLVVNFFNNSKGANRFVYDFGDGTGTRLTNAAPEVVQHVFDKAGVYKVTLFASNNCSKAETVETITVLDQPTVGFTSDKTIGCDGTLVKFKNTSKNAIGYLWDFGDGTTSAAFEPQHTYKGSGVNYTVTLTSTNISGCNNAVTAQNYISIVAPPQAFFTIIPGNEISIPNYSFSFKDTSVGAVSWEWNFGDGSSATLQHPNHTYLKEGVYNVTLKILNKEGCSSTTFQSVRIVDVPGNLNLPNSFMPASAQNELRTFKAKGSGIRTWKMSVFNKWGQLIWETTKLDQNAPAEGWDGTFNGVEQPQGIYYWKVDVEFINGGLWKGMAYDSSAPKKTGIIYLIR